jgi:DNA-binding CsgD family transcriptional regulator
MSRKVTPRELEVLALIAEDYSTREIARVLWITEERSGSTCDGF